jgi:hypothetical protein
MESDFGSDPNRKPSRLAEIYYQYIRDNCPPAACID